MSEKIKYSCKACGWTTSIRQEWADMKPKRCMNKKCNTSFVASPDSLETTLPVAVVPSVAEVPQFKKKKKNEEQDN